MSVKARGFTEGIPHNKALGMELLELERGEAKFRLPYDAKLVGNPDTGVLHGGAITALLDASSGASVFAALTDWVPIATLDLRIDYVRPSTPGEPLYARVECYKVTHHVAFCRGFAYNKDESDVVASTSGTFMLRTQALPHAVPGGGESGGST
jgi:uncharacterized protein (TIGR00369 family)